MNAEYEAKGCKTGRRYADRKKYSDKEIIDISELEAEADNAANMIKHLSMSMNEWRTYKEKRKFEKTVRRTYRKNKVGLPFTERNIQAAITPH